MNEEGGRHRPHAIVEDAPAKFQHEPKKPDDGAPVTSASSGRAVSALNLGTLLRPNVRVTGFWLVLAAIIAYGALTTNGFLTLNNARAIAASVSIGGIIAVGMTFILLSGNLFSLSLATTTAVTAMTFLYVLPLGLVGAVLVAALTGAVIGMVQGWFVGAWRANPIIVTIAAGATQTGAATWITGGHSVSPSGAAPDFSILSKPIHGLPPEILVFVAVVALTDTLVRYTTFGREMMLVGASRTVARAAGIRVGWIVTCAFTLAGACAGIAGIMLGAASGNGSLDLQGTYTYDAIAAALVGGSAIAGGNGSILRTALGAFGIGVVLDILLLRGFGEGARILFEGAIVVVVVVLSHRRIATRKVGKTGAN